MEGEEFLIEDFGLLIGNWHGLDQCLDFAEG